MGPTVLSWSVRWNVELVIGFGDSHRVRVGDQSTCGKRQEGSSVGGMGCGSDTRNESSPMVPRRQ